MPKLIYVVAGNYRQYQNFITNSIRMDLNNRNRYVYFSVMDQFLGVRNPDVIFIGTYYNRKDINEINEQCRIINATIKYWRGVVNA